MELANQAFRSPEKGCRRRVSARRDGLRAAALSDKAAQGVMHAGQDSYFGGFD